MTTPSDDFLLVGEITAPFGTRGQVKMRSFTDHADHLARRIRTLYLGPEYTPTKLKSAFEHKPGLLILTLDGVSSRDSADQLRGTEVAIREHEAVPLDEGEYFIHQLYGLAVVNQAGEAIGTVRDVLETGANDVLVVQRAGMADALIPMIHDAVQELDVANKRVVIKPLEGLL